MACSVKVKEIVQSWSGHIINLDSDDDGVNDGVDQCLETPPGTPVDNTGCAIVNTDSDNDGVNDKSDQCPDTVPGASVDSYGCSLTNGSDCDEINIYPNWLRKDYSGGPFTHNNESDKIQYQGNVYSANWYTKSVPGSDGSWTLIGSCQ